MYINRTVFMAVLAAAVTSIVTLAAQQPAAQGGQPAPAQRAVRANPTPGCVATPEQEEAAMQLVMNPVGNPNDRIDPSYKQHNPAFLKAGREMGLSDYAYFMQAFGARGRGQGGGGRQGGGPGGAQGANAAPQPPGPNNGNEIVLVQCDIVIQIHMNWRQDPTLPPGNFFQAYTFDAWRVRGDKIVEHWDSAVINPPAAAPAGAPAAAPAGGRGN